MIGHGGLLSVFLHSPDKGFWAGLEDSPPDGQRLGFCNTKHSSAVLGSDSPQSNNS